MSTLVLNDITATYRAMTQYNANNTLIENAINATIHQDGSRAMQANLDMGTSYRIINVADPTNAQDAATKAYVDGIVTTNAAIADITPSDGTLIVGNGTTWVGESGNTARTSLGLGSTDNVTFGVATLSGLKIGSSATFTALLDEDDLVSNSATALASQQSIKTYVDRLNRSSVSDVSNLTAGQTGTTLVKTTRTPRRLFGQTYDAYDVTPYFYEADVKTTADGADVVLPSGSAASDAGRYKRANVLDTDGDSPLPLSDHLKHAHRNATKSWAKADIRVDPKVIQGMRIEGDHTSAYDLIELYSDFVPWQSSAVYDSIGMNDADSHVFTIPRTRMAKMDVQLTVQCGTAGNAFVGEIWKLPSSSNISGWAVQGGGSGSPIAFSTVVNLKKTNHGMSVGDFAKLNVSASNCSDITALDEKYVELTAAPDADTIQFVVPTAFSAAPTSGSIVVTAASGTLITTTSAHGLAATDWTYLEDVDGVTDGWYQVFNAPLSTTFNIIGISASGVTGSPLAYPLTSTITLDDYGPVASRDVLCHNQIDVTETSVPNVIPLSSGIRQFTEGDKYIVRVRAPSGSAATMPASSSTFNPESFFEYQEYGYLSPTLQQPNLGRRMAVVQGTLEYMYKDVKAAIADLKDFRQLILSGVANIDDAGTLYNDIDWPTNTKFAGGGGVSATKYTHQRELIRGIRGENERAEIYGYVAMSADAPRGTQAGQGDWTGGNAISNIGTGTTSTATIAADGTKVKVTETAHGYVDNDWCFIPAGGGGGATDLENAGFVVEKIDNDNFYLMLYNGSAGSGPYVDNTGLTVSGTNATINDHWTVTDVPNVRAWINAWREDGVTGIFFDLSASQWCKPAVRDLAIQECRKAGLKAMFNVASVNTGGVNTTWLLGSNYTAPGDYIYYEGAGGKEVNAGAGLTPTTGSNTISKLEDELEVLDNNAHRGVHACMSFTEENPGGAVSLGVASITDNGSGKVRVTFDSAHPYSTSDVVRFNGFRDTNNLDMDTLTGIDHTLTDISATEVDITALDFNTLTTYSKSNSDTNGLCTVQRVTPFTNSGALWSAFKAIVDARPIEDTAGAMSSDLGGTNLAPPHAEPSWGAFEDQ